MKSTGRGRKIDDGGIRELILAAAMEALREDGVHGLSQVHIARRAKVRQSHLTYYFPKRHDLIEAMATRFVDGIAHGVDPAAATGSADDALRSLLRHLAAVVVDRGHMRMFTAMIVEADGDPKVRAILVRVTLRLQSMLAARLGGDDPDQRAGTIIANLWGLGLYDFLLRPKRPGERVASYIAGVTNVTAPRKRASVTRHAIRKGR